MRNWINLIESVLLPWGHGQAGCWVLPDGEVLPCDYEADEHHADIAFRYLDFPENQDPDEMSEINDVAFDHGWIRVRLSATDFMVQCDPTKISQKAVSVLPSFNDGHIRFMLSCVDHGNQVFTSMGQMMSHLRSLFARIDESAPRTLYHGTLKEYLPEIEKNGLVPTVGDFVNNFYDPSGDEGYDPETDALDPLVFAASKRDLQRCVNAIVFRLRDSRIDATSENIIKHGAIVAYRDDDEQFHKRPADDSERDYTDHPTQVEPGDFYSYEDIMPTYIVTGKRLRDLLRRNRINGFFSTKPVD